MAVFHSRFRAEQCGARTRLVHLILSCQEIRHIAALAVRPGGIEGIEGIEQLFIGNEQLAQRYARKLVTLDQAAS